MEWSVSPGKCRYILQGLEIHDGNTGDDESFFKFRTIDLTITMEVLLT